MKLIPIRTFIGALAAALIVACSGNGGTGPDPEPDPDPDPNVVTIRLTSGLRFSPADVEIDAGTTVRWFNDAAIFHTVTPDDPSQSGVWQRRTTVARGEVFRHTFTQSGQTYTYHCEPHLADGMVATIRVR